MTSSLCWRLAAHLRPSVSCSCHVPPVARVVWGFPAGRPVPRRDRMGPRGAAYAGARAGLGARGTSHYFACNDSGDYGPQSLPHRPPHARLRGARAPGAGAHTGLEPQGTSYYFACSDPGDDRPQNLPHCLLHARPYGARAPGAVRTIPWSPRWRGSECRSPMLRVPVHIAGAWARVLRPDLQRSSLAEGCTAFPSWHVLPGRPRRAAGPEGAGQEIFPPS